MPSSEPAEPSSHAVVRASRARRVAQWLRGFWPTPVAIDGRERARMVAGAVAGVLIASLLARWVGAELKGPWMVASLGASAVLVFGMPSSPLAQPWPVAAGNTLSALVGAACAALVPDVAVAGALAVGAAIAMMLSLRCLHPPGGAMALFAVIHHDSGAQLAAFPVLFNVLVLLAVGIAYNRFTGRPYPHTQRALQPQAAGRFTAADLDAALRHYNEVLDVSRADLEGLLHLAGRAAFQRTLGELRCAAIMSSPAHAVEAGVSLKDAWALMRKEKIKALPVVDGDRRVIGIVTVSDFMRLAHLDTHEGMGRRLRLLVMGRPARPAFVKELMTQPVQQASQDQHVMDLVPLFSEAGHHHLPIVNGRQQLVGIITQTDLVKALAVAVGP